MASSIDLILIWFLRGRQWFNFQIDRSWSLANLLTIKHNTLLLESDNHIALQMKHGSLSMCGMWNFKERKLHVRIHFVLYFENMTPYKVKFMLLIKNDY